MHVLKQIKYYGSFIGLLLVSSETMAQTISWSQINASPVPLSTTAMLVLALLLFVISKYFYKNKSFVKNNIYVVTVLAGLLFLTSNILGSKAFALAFASIISINSPSGREHLSNNGTTQVTNTYTTPILITAVDPEGCTISSNACTVGTVLNNNESCEITVSCNTAPVWTQTSYNTGLTVQDNDDSVNVIQDLSTISSDNEGDSITYTIEDVSVPFPTEKSYWLNALYLENKTLKVRNLFSIDPDVDGEIVVTIKASDGIKSSNANISFLYHDTQ